MNKNFSYWLKGNLYLSLTYKLNSTSFISLRGQSFNINKNITNNTPNTSTLIDITNTYEPNNNEVIELINNCYNENKIIVNSMKSESITFAGLGEPLYRINDICEITKEIHQNRHGVPFRIITNGLLATNPDEIASQLYEARIKQISIPLLTDNPKQYLDIMKPHDPNVGFHTVCNFIVACVEKGLIVTCTAVERPDVNISRVRSLSQSLGAPLFSTYSYHP